MKLIALDIHSWFNDVMLKDGFEDILSQPLVDGALLIMTISYGEVYQVVLDIMLGQSLESVLYDVFHNISFFLFIILSC